VTDLIGWNPYPTSPFSSSLPPSFFSFFLPFLLLPLLPLLQYFCYYGVPRTPMEIARLEEYHAICDCYLWLSVHFPTDIFIESQEAQETADKCSELIDVALRKLKPSEKSSAGSGSGSSKGSGKSKYVNRRRR